MPAFHNFAFSFGLQAILSMLRFVGPNRQGTGSDRFNVIYDIRRSSARKVIGTGLGLAIVKELCRVLNGQNNFASRERGGTSFEIQFPLVPEKPE
ncbi:ATP-binding protein [Paraburkholderia elongata]|uniref:histidine kinase n=1 Tax=Paraburkholderia elongata TaxID=2675747 RepID=A0A972NTD8_9BURK|nr:ATP-binding protein [Paraburkholderia elongata]NPT58209.1 hypothetical protein [Paraburkholderia elongata]